MKIKQENLLIKSIDKNKVDLFIKEENIGTLTYNINKNEANISISINKANYESAFIKMFINYLFKNKKIDKVSFNNTIYTPENFYFMRKYKTLLMDIDDTVLSFSKAEKKALSVALTKVGLKVNDEILKHYHQINIKYWEMVERNEITRDACLILRFKEFLPLYGINYDPAKFEDLYRFYLNKQYHVMKNARKVLTLLQNNYRIYAVTNGVKETQKFRISKSNMEHFFIKSFISEEIGHNKPSIDFFKVVKENIEDFDFKTTLIIGDSLTSDVKLGINNNVDTCWFNFNFKENNSDIKPTYQINSLLELLY